MPRAPRRTRRVVCSRYCMVMQLVVTALRGMPLRGYSAELPVQSCSPQLSGRLCALRELAPFGSRRSWGVRAVTEALAERARES
jgi:hypothetical protein